VRILKILSEVILIIKYKIKMENKVKINKVEVMIMIFLIIITCYALLYNNHLKNKNDQLTVEIFKLKGFYNISLTDLQTQKDQKSKMQDELLICEEEMADTNNYNEYLFDLLELSRLNGIMIYLNDNIAMGYQVYVDHVEYYMRETKQINTQIYEDYKSRLNDDYYEFMIKTYRLVLDNYEITGDNYERVELLESK